MTTSNGPVRTSSTDTLRVVLAAPRKNRPLDGGWWPHSRDLAAELAELVGGLPTEAGRAVRAVYSPPDWDTPPRRVPLARGYLKVGSFPRDDSHVLDLRMLDGTTLRLLVVPPTADPQQARSALQAAAEPAGTGTATSILATMAPRAGGPSDPAWDDLTSDGWEDEPSDPEEHWTDDGGAWWDPHPVSPSYRPEE
jgi:hypothetical protein